MDSDPGRRVEGARVVDTPGRAHRSLVRAEDHARTGPPTRAGSAAEIAPHAEAGPDV